jgi:hypothetical protein
MTSVDDRFTAIDNAYKKVQKMKAENKYNYTEIKEDPVEPIHIGSICSDEYGVNKGSLKSMQRWSILDTAQSCFENAHRIASQHKFEEDVKISSNEITKTAGFAMTTMDLKDFNEDKVNYFLDETSTTVSDFNIVLQPSKCVEFFGYFTPPLTGEYTFYCSQPDIFQMWVLNETAAIDFLPENADVSSRKRNNLEPSSVKITMRKNKYYPIRIHLGNSSRKEVQGPLFYVDTPSETGILSNSNFQYFNSLSENGMPFNVQPLYFGLYRSLNDKFQCSFIVPSKENYDLVRRMKTNDELAYYHVEIPTTITYTSGTYNSKVPKGTDMNVTTPAGALIDVKSSKYGLDKDREENFPYVVDETKTKTIDKIYHRTFEGDWKGNESFFNTAKVTSEKEVSLIETNLNTGTSHMFEVDITRENPGWYVQFYMYADGYATLHLVGKDYNKKFTVVPGTNKDVANNKYELMPYEGTKKVKVYFSSNVPNGRIVLYHRIRYRSKRKWRWGRWENLDTFKQSHTYSYVAKVTKDDWRTVKSTVDTTDNVSTKVNENKISVSGNYDQIFGDPAPGYDGKNLNVSYGFTQSFDSNNPDLSITNKSIYVDETGQLTIGYDYNKISNSQQISYLTNAELCDDADNCKYSLLIEDDGGFSIMDESGSRIWNKKVFDDKVDPELVVANETWMNNPKSRNTLDIGDKLSQSGVPELVSNNGKYKLSFVNGLLTLTYCIVAYEKTTIENREVYYTDSKHIDGDAQIFNLYRIHCDGLMGKKMLARTNDSGNIRTLEHLPNSHTEVLRFKKFNVPEEGNIYPLLQENEYKKIYENATNNSVSVSNLNDFYSISDVSQKECEESCEKSSQCEHFFFMNTKTGDKCIQDIGSNSIPLFTRMNPDAEKISTSSMNKKMYSIYSTCDNTERKTQLTLDSVDKYSNYEVIYDSKHSNDFNKTYHCTNDLYKESSDLIYSEYSSSTSTAGESVPNVAPSSTIEGMSAYDYIINERIPEFEEKAKKASDNHERVREVSGTIDTEYAKFDASWNSMYGSNGVIRDNGVPDIFKKDMPLKPETNVSEAREKDAKLLLKYENTLYTIATLSAATIIITTIILARE